MEINIDGLKQDMQRAFMEVTPYTLVEDEVEAVYLALTRLREIETAAERGDIAEVHALLGIEKAPEHSTSVINKPGSD